MRITRSKRESDRDKSLMKAPWHQVMHLDLLRWARPQECANPSLKCPHQASPTFLHQSTALVLAVECSNNKRVKLNPLLKSNQLLWSNRLLYLVLVFLTQSLSTTARLALVNTTLVSSLIKWFRRLSVSSKTSLTVLVEWKKKRSSLILSMTMTRFSLWSRTPLNKKDYRN